MASPFQLPRRLRTIRTIDKYGRSAALPETCTLCFRHFAWGRPAACLLAGVLELARQVSAGSGRGAAAGAAADGSWILCSGRHGPARPARKTVAILFRPRPGVYFRGPRSCVGPLQLAVR